MDFGKKLKKLLKEKDMTQTDLANKINISHPVISRWIKGHSNNPKMETLEKIAKALNVDVTSEVFTNGMKEIVKGMLNKKSYPCLIHCVEGQDRTGFSCAMFELFMGADYDSVEADYVKTFMNYYKVKENTEQYRTIAKNIYVNLDRAFKERIKGYEGLDKKKTQQLAKEYFKSLGFTEEQLNQLWDNLSK